MPVDAISESLKKSAARSGDLWAITCFFNPAGFKRRLETYRLFRKRLAVPLVAVEFSHDGNFQLLQEDADVLVQIEGGDVMWQKERLLNIAMKHVPVACKKIAWLDCDVVFGRKDWMEFASRALDEHYLVHLFQERHDLPRDGALDQHGNGDSDSVAPSIIHKMAAEKLDSENLLFGHPTTKRLWTTGLAWASRRDVLERHGLYDGLVMGSGDQAVLYAALGKFVHATVSLRLNARRQAHYLAWAKPYFETVRGRVGYIPGRLHHLWHGELKDRQYAERIRRFETFDFDPYIDIALDHNGCWRWNSSKHAMHEFVRHYFETRKEDGA